MYVPPSPVYDLGSCSLYDPVIDQLDLAVGEQIEVKEVDAFPVILSGRSGKCIRQDTGILENWSNPPPKLDESDVFLQLGPKQETKWQIDYKQLPDAWIAPVCVYDFVNQEFQQPGLWAFGGLYDTLNWSNPECSCGRIYHRVASDLIAITSHRPECHGFQIQWKNETLLLGGSRVLVSRGQ
jgi:hypothetical protein